MLSYTFHLAKWYAMDECFLFKDDSTFKVLVTTLLLSHRMCVGLPSFWIGIPNIFVNLNLRCSTSSMHCLSTMNSDKKALVSTVCCLLLSHFSGALFTNDMWSEWDIWVTSLAPWKESTKAVVRTAILCGILMAVRTSSMMVVVSFQFEPLSRMKLVKGMTMEYKLLNNPVSLG